MPFIRIPGKPGRFFVSGTSPDAGRRFPCLDCRTCQWCTDERCRVCRSGLNGERLCISVRPPAGPAL